MASIGDWSYKGNPSGTLYDENGTPILFNGQSEVTFAFDGLKVSDAAQTTASIGFTVNPVKDLSIYSNWNYYGNYFGQINFNRDYLVAADGSTTRVAQKGALEYPSYNLFDVGLSYNFKLEGGKSLVLTGNVYNVFDTTYISDSRSSIHVKELADFSTSTSGGVTTTAQQKYDAYINNPSNFYDGIDATNQVYFGFGRTWAASIAFKF